MKISVRGVADDGKLRFGASFVCGQGQIIIYLAQCRENAFFRIAQRPENTHFLDTNKKSKILCLIPRNGQL